MKTFARWLMPLLGFLVAAAIMVLCPGPVGAVEGGSCAFCHEKLGDAGKAIVNDWKASIHFERGIACDDCLGGNAAA